jgi:hypothetical protein
MSRRVGVNDFLFSNTDDTRNSVYAVNDVLASIRNSCEKDLTHLTRGESESLKQVLLQIERARLSFLPSGRRIGLDWTTVAPRVVGLVSDIDQLLKNPDFTKITKSIQFRLWAPARARTHPLWVTRIASEDTVERATRHFRDVLQTVLDDYDNDLTPPRQLLELSHIVPSQKIGPAQFEIRNGRLALAKISMFPPEEDKANVLAAREHLRANGENILSELEQSNCDRRLIESLRSLQEMLNTEGGNIIQLGLANIGCEVMCSSFKDELPVAVASMVQAHTRGIQLFVGQFLEWHRFIENAASVQLVDNDITELREGVATLVDDLQAKPDLVEPEVPKILARINELLNAPGVARKRVAFALLRSIENLISKVFSYMVEFCDKTASKVVDSASDAVSKVVYIGLLTLALGGAYAISPIAGKVSEMQWVKTAADIVQKQLETLLKELPNP